MSDPEAEIRVLFATYAAGVQNADAAAVTALFASPATIWQFGEGHVFAHAKDLAENVDALIDVFDEAAIASTLPEVKDVRAADATAYAGVLWRQRDADGELLHEFACHYLLIRQDAAWRIAMVVNEAAADPRAP